MAYSVKVLGCDSQCEGCYETKVRDANLGKYNLVAIVKALEAGIENNPDWNPPVVHGGEPLTLPPGDLKNLLKVIYKGYKRSGIQTNLRALLSDHIDMFVKYNTHIGVSLDGNTVKMNSGRGYDPAPVIENMRKLKAAKIPFSIIIVLRKCNSNFTALHMFINMLKCELGVESLKTNLMIDHRLGAPQEIPAKILSQLLISLADMALARSDIMIHPFRGIVDQLLGGQGECTFTKCDPMHTIAEVPIMQDGTLGNCLKNHGATDGIFHLRSDAHSNARYEALFATPQSAGGCKNCPYWFACFGGCPGSGIDNDWRNRTRFCSSWLAVFKHIEKKLKSIFPNIHTVSDFYPDKIPRRNSLSFMPGSVWAEKDRQGIKVIIGKFKTKGKGTKQDPNHGDSYTDEHGDVQHGDHTDMALLRRAK